MSLGRVGTLEKYFDQLRALDQILNIKIYYPMEILPLDVLKLILGGIPPFQRFPLK